MATYQLYDHTSKELLGTFGSRGEAVMASAYVVLGHGWAVWEFAEAPEGGARCVGEGIRGRELTPRRPAVLVLRAARYSSVSATASTSR